MKLMYLAGLLVMCPTFISAEAMTSLDIVTALSERKLVYGDAWQAFYDSGRTLYNADVESWGYWQVENDQYCSQWPPSDTWDCYDMVREGDLIRFIASDGRITDGVYAE